MFHPSRRLLLVLALTLWCAASARSLAGEVTITAYYGGINKRTQERTVPFEAGDTAMSASMRALRMETNPEHTFVKSIEGVANNDANKEYWLYFVNGDAMHVGASETKLQPGDRVLWFLRRQSSATHDPPKK